MIGRYAVLSQRIRQELAEIETVVTRVERAMAMRQVGSVEDDLYLDAAALNLHAFYTGLERIFRQIGVELDGSVPAGGEWHRDLLQQMAAELPGLRPLALSTETARALNEYLRFRHIVRNIYAFQLDPERVERLTSRLPLVWATTRAELLRFADVLDDLAHSA
jgi:hypothetical protein